MKLTVRSGSAIAAAAASLLLAGAVSVPAFAADDAAGHCVGANACKGQSACKTATSACNGQNACKGQGFTETTKDECDKIEGAKFEPAKS
jgi:uncharacterized membrane protein